MLDFYQVRWEYEQRSFPLAWNEQGVPTESFTPDFYLPEFDLYVELTTLRQPLVTRKNRKLRRLRELYPQVRVKLLYRNDVHKLLSKYGLSLFAEHGAPPTDDPAESLRAELPHDKT